MSPDKVHTVAMMAATLMTHPEPCSLEEAPALAYKMYREVEALVRASGPTSKEPECQWGQPTYCGEPTCPKHGNG